MLALAFFGIMFITVIIVCLTLSRPRSRVRHNNQRLGQTLTRLLGKPRGSYIIIEAPDSGKYLQVSGSIAEPIIFDLPCQSLTLDEYDRADTLFKRCGYPGPETFTIYSPSTGRHCGTQTSFLLTWSRENMVQLQELILQVFSQIYQVDDSSVLHIIEQ
ncbi:MAG: hypothetical protein JXQ81_12670 [Desulfuromonadales bacterium]|nr:hypothetical protein [Desulfuromonadales bacterium]MBN2793355.1 hypothetical protein [Desulfuromonadales bacterium]